MAKLTVIAAPSGAGKTSLIEALLKDSGDVEFNLSISYTTREKRINEKDGESYFFIEKREFERMLKNKVDCVLQTHWSLWLGYCATNSHPKGYSMRA